MRFKIAHILYILYLLFMEFSLMSIHIGKIIKKLVKKKAISVTDFADKINYSRRNVYEIFDRETIDSGLLIKINKVLEENLFLNYLTDEDINKFKNSKSTPEELKEILNNLKSEIKKLVESNLTGKKRLSKKKAKSKTPASNI